MRRRIVALAILFAALMLDTSVVPVLTDWHLMPSFTFVTVLVLAVYLGRARGVLYGLGTGLLVDILVGYPVGFMMALYTAAGFVVGLLAYLNDEERKKMGRKVYLRRAVSVFAVWLAVEAVVLGYQYFHIARLEGEYFLNVLLRAAIGTAATMLLGPAEARMMLGKPKQSSSTNAHREVKSF